MNRNQKVVVLFFSLIYAVHSAALTYDLFASRPKHCMEGKMIESNYTPRGSEYEIGNLTVYESDNRAAQRLLIAVHDIFGMHENIKQIADEIGNLYNFRVIVPDFFHGFPWDLDRFPPEE